MLIAAIDTYVIVLALPAIMADVGIGIDQLQAATPIVSGFLLGYVVVMPLLGRFSDIYGRRPLLMLVPRGLRCRLAGDRVRARPRVGGGGPGPPGPRRWRPGAGHARARRRLWPAERRGLPLGVVGGVQELGACSARSTVG